MSLEWLFLALHWLGTTVYCGSVIGFALLLGLAPRLERVDEVATMDVYRSWGAILGLSMGCLIFGGLGAWFLQHGQSFVWPSVTEADQLSLAKLLVFLVLWVSSFHLEIWTLDPIRKLQSDGPVADRAAWDQAYQRVTLQLTGNTVLILIVAGLGLLAAQA